MDDRLSVQFNVLWNTLIFKFLAADIPELTHGRLTGLKCSRASLLETLT